MSTDIELVATKLKEFAEATNNSFKSVSTIITSWSERITTSEKGFGEIIVAAIDSIKTLEKRVADLEVAFSKNNTLLCDALNEMRGQIKKLEGDGK